MPTYLIFESNTAPSRLAEVHITSKEIVYYVPSIELTIIYNIEEDFAILNVHTMLGLRITDSNSLNEILDRLEELMSDAIVLAEYNGKP